MAVPRSSSSSFLPAHVLAQDRDSGISTEGESDAEMFSSTNNSRPTTLLAPMATRQATYPFSDDEELPSIQESLQQQQEQILNSEAMFSSKSYQNHQAEQAMVSIKQLLKEDSWKKALKHKSGVVVYMLNSSSKQNSNNNKAPIFKGETVIHGFSPQSVFYVIGMRKLWDPAFEEGRLIENLNETTSITYESYRSSSSSKAYDVSVVERIECSADGVILFACTSIETPKIPKMPGRTRRQMKLQGWILKPLHTTPPSTKVTYITQESVKGWIPGLTKKSLARRPLVIADVQKYLQQKAERSKENNRFPTGTSSTTATISDPTISQAGATTAIIMNGSSVNHSNSSTLLNPSGNTHGQRRPSIMSQQQQTVQKPKSILQKTPSTSLLHPKSNSMQSILTNPPPRNSSLPSPTSSRSSSVTRKIKFADDDISQRSSTPSSLAPSTHIDGQDDDATNEGENNNNSTNTLTLSTASVLAAAAAGSSPQNMSRLYPPSRHRTSRKQCIETLKRLSSSDLDEWKEMGERNSTKLYSKSVQGSALPILRGDVTLHGQWTPEQVCSVIQCFGARKIWDEYFETGHVAERFSQKEYLVYTQMRSIFPIHSRDFSLLTVIDSDPGTGTIHVASTSVSDGLIPTIKPHVRGQIIVYGWVLRPLKGKGVALTFISHMDLEGTTPLPPAIIRQLTVEVPACADRVQWYLRQHGCPPYIRRVAGKITQEHFNSKDKTYRISFTAKHKPSQHRQHSNWCTDIRTNQSMYGSGFDVQVGPAEYTRVELRADDMGIRIYTLDDSLEGHLVEVAIIPNLPGSAPKYTWNGKSLKEEKKEEKKVIIEEPLKHHQQQREEEQQQQQVMPATMPPTPPLLATPEDEDEKLEPSISLTSVPDEFHPQQELDGLSRQRRPEPLKTTKLDPSESWFHALHDSRVTTPTTATTRDLMRRRNSHVLVISDELSFTGPQLSVIFLLMAVCYYMGKLSCRC
ncbi:hypothetical protein BDA99DRAFT_459862 [Phascolomyces articulosus]|uniref:START domain-containing protein n=1 Tax=Phascolomyces articulosus TaxID=60185 RepID=A0AAD5KFZ6_9FUNG|nr:hypothetical protein BDA99DRAFT_459862 [Phascolomyces articulosus]